MQTDPYYSPVILSVKTESGPGSARRPRRPSLLHSRANVRGFYSFETLPREPPSATMLMKRLTTAPTPRTQSTASLSGAPRSMREHRIRTAPHTTALAIRMAPALRTGALPCVRGRYRPRLRFTTPEIRECERSSSLRSPSQERSSPSHTRPPDLRRSCLSCGTLPQLSLHRSEHRLGASGSTRR